MALLRDAAPTVAHLVHEGPVAIQVEEIQHIALSYEPRPLVWAVRLRLFTTKRAFTAATWPSASLTPKWNQRRRPVDSLPTRCHVLEPLELMFTSIFHGFSWFLMVFPCFFA